MTWFSTRNGGKRGDAAPKVRRANKDKGPALEALEDRCLLAYTVTDLGTLGGTTSVAHGINDAGTTVGEARVTGFRYSHAFNSTGEAMIDLGVINNKQSRAEDINADGHVIGSSNYFAGSASLWTAVVYKNGTKVNLGAFGGPLSYGTGINAGGFAVGYANYSGGTPDKFHAFKWDPSLPASQKVDLGTLGGDDSRAYEINNAGQVVGISKDSGGLERAVIWNGTTETDIGVLPGYAVGSEARGINSTGKVVGGSYGLFGQHQQRIYHGFIYDSTTATQTDLGNLGQGGNYSFAYDINDVGQVVGTANTTFGDSPRAAWIWQSGVMTDLNSQIPQGTGWVLSEAFAINNNGQIVGYGFKDGQLRAFRLTPSGSPVSNGRNIEGIAAANTRSRVTQPLQQAPTTFEASIQAPVSGRYAIEVGAGLDTPGTAEKNVRPEVKRATLAVGRTLSVLVTANIDDNPLAVGAESM